MLYDCILVVRLTTLGLIQDCVVCTGVCIISAGSVTLEPVMCSVPIRMGPVYHARLYI
uniref:ATP sulfurylase n=1 Tax=Arundo donax TaxID=35708 RepID=A0A0A9A1I9_ARUDO